jgi:hypothetical protein
MEAVTPAENRTKAVSGVSTCSIVEQFETTRRERRTTKPG